MPMHYVPFITTASFTMTIEADSPEEAIDRAGMEADFPYFPGGMTGDLGDWEIQEDEVEEA